MHVALAGVVAAVAVSAAGCSSGGQGVAVPIGLRIVAPKGLLSDADSVSLSVYQKGTCKGPDVDLSTSPPMLGAPHALAKPGTDASKKCSDGSKWCVNFEVNEDPTLPLAWYIEGTRAGSKSFRGCTVRAVDQTPLNIDIRVERVLVGTTCGDGVITPPKTCDPSGGAGDEACDAATCTTQEVILSNGKGADGYYRGRPGRKTDVSLRWLDDGKFYGIWADMATGGLGGDGGGEISWRRMLPSLATDASALLLKTEVRLQNGSFTPAGGKQRSGSAGSPTILPVEAGNLLVVFQRAPAGDTSHIYTSLQRPNLSQSSADVSIGPSTGTQQQPSAAVGATGEVLIAYVDSNAIRSVLRKPGGALQPVQTVSTSGANATPRVAFVGTEFLVVWFDGNDIKMRRVGLDGAPKGAEQVVNASRKAGKHDQPAVAGFPSGEFLVAWRESGADGDVGNDIRAQRFDAVGAPVGIEINAPINDVFGSGDQSAPAVTVSSAASGLNFYFVAWVDEARPQLAGRFIGQAGDFLYNPVDGKKSEFPIGLPPSRPFSSPALAVGGPAPGFCAVAWVDDSDADPAGDDDRVRVRRFPLPTQP